MGIVNFTPDSFFDGGKYNTLDKALLRIEKLVKEGADIVDIGGESTRPGSDSISLEEELNRVLPLIEKAAKEFDVILSIDSTKEMVVKEALQAGVSIVNDISGLRFEPEIATHVANNDAAIILMHTPSRPWDMQKNTEYDNLIENMISSLMNSVKTAKEYSVPDEKIIIDPGIGFGKTSEQNFQIIRDLKRFCEMGFPLLIGTSRKSFIGNAFNNLPPENRLAGSLITAVISVKNGASILRVHDVEETRQALEIFDYLNEKSSVN